MNIGAFTIRIGLGGTKSYSHYKEPERIVLQIAI